LRPGQRLPSAAEGRPGPGPAGGRRSRRSGQEPGALTRRRRETHPSGGQRKGVRATNRICPDNVEAANSPVIVARQGPLLVVPGLVPFTIGCVGLSCSDALPLVAGGSS